MHSAYREITQQYAGLKALTLDVNNFLQDPKNYVQFDPNIRNAILQTPDNPAIPAYIKELPQVKLIQNIRHSVQTIANDFESADYTKLPKIIYHLRNFWDVAKAYLLAEETICLSPEFNSKLVSFINFVVQCNEVFREELTVISSKPKIIFSSPEIEYGNTDTKQWYYYREKVKALQKVLSKDNKLKPYIHNLEHLISFIIDLKEKGIIKANPVATILDFIESFNNVSQTSLKEIFQEYAILSKTEIKEILKQINHFWSSFLPICDEIEINTGLTTGYLTQRLSPVFQFCNILELEFNPDSTELTYPFTETRLSRIQQGMEETNALLLKQTLRKQKLNELHDLVEEFTQDKKLNPEKLIPLHQNIQLLSCDESLKSEFHHLIDDEVASRSIQLGPNAEEALEFSQLLNKYKLHEASLAEVQQLFSLLQDPKFDTSAQNYYQDLSNEYSESITNFETTIENIEKAKIKNKDIKHLLIMIHSFETLEVEAEKKSEIVGSALKRQIDNLDQLQGLLDLFEQNQLQEQDFYQLLSSIEFLDCDLSMKKKFKKQISELDHKRKNGGYLGLVSDFFMGFFTEVTVPFSEIRKFIQDKKAELQTIIDENVKPVLTAIPVKKPIVVNVADQLLEPINFVSKKVQWANLKRTVNLDIAENEQRVLSTQSIQSYQSERYEQLKTLLKSYKPPVSFFDEIEEDNPRDNLWGKYFSTLFKSGITKATSLVTSIYSQAKKAFSYVKSFFVNKPLDLQPIELVRKEPTVDPILQPIKISDVSPYKELGIIEDKIAWVLEKLVDPTYFAKLQNTLTTHKMIPLTKDMPYFYRQGAEIVNTFILFRKVLLSYSHLDMLQLTLAVSNMNAENKLLLKAILEDSTLSKSSSFYEQSIKPTLANSYQTIANLKAEESFTTSLPQVIHTIHNGIKLIAQNKKLNLEPFLAFLRRVETNFNESNKTNNPDLIKLYASLNKLSHFVEKVLNNQENLLVEVLFSLADLSHQFQQVSTSITELLIKDKFPYQKELSELMKNLQEILLLFQNNIDQFKAEGLHPNVISSLKDSVSATESFVDKLTPMEFHKTRILLSIEQIQSGINKISLDRPLKNELNNIRLLLTTKADKTLIDQKILDSIDARLKEIKQKISESYSQGCFGFFSRCNPFNKANDTPQNAHENIPRNRLAK